ncbi:ABC super ATP binding cassette transporter permease subunit [Romboutsia ilealis]|uniref:ABC super ATP binding cassette transporter permease subunit n=1 Tax=Romboutsia ilealis TaxID=1115758 RepID=A0A1V1I0P6_9FIRM|nr:ABC transporter permease [Romboutsia ilealis]CED93798.1 ABC super ATP binding cassette transporter permease subunit [Romboutsia ilealis]
MLGKLLKYELKATSRVFIPLYIAILVVSIVNGLSLNLEIFNIQGLATIILMCLFISLFVITIVVTIQRFNKNLLKDEGYLMFTLPVSSKSLVLSKYLTSLIWTFLSFVVAFLSFNIIFIIPTYKYFDFSYFVNEFNLLFSNMLNLNILGQFIKIILLMVISYTIFIFNVYLSLSIGQLPIFNRFRNISSFIGFLVINLLISYAQNTVSLFVNDASVNIEAIDNINYAISSVTSIVSKGLNIAIVINLIIILVLFFATTYILDKKLNLE